MGQTFLFGHLRAIGPSSRIAAKLGIGRFPVRAVVLHSPQGNAKRRWYEMQSVDVDYDVIRCAGGADADNRNE